MSDHPLDHAVIVNNLFFPRKTAPHTHPDKDRVKDGFIPIEGDVKLGYRLHIHNSTAPVMLHFHGNGEIATDYEALAPYYNQAGVSLLVVDYRGYGWSTGTPLVTRMLPDAQIAFDAVPAILGEHGLVPGRPLFLKGRSLGSAAAVYLAHQNPGKIRGLIIESGYADAPSLFPRLGIPIPQELTEDIHLPLNNVHKIKQCDVPLLLIHGAQDMVIPVTQGKQLYEASPSKDKQQLILPGAGHNNLLAAGLERYFNAIRDFVAQHQA